MTATTTLNAELSMAFAITPTAELAAILRLASNPDPPAALASLAEEMGHEAIVSIVVSLVGAIYARRLRDEREGA